MFANTGFWIALMLSVVALSGCLSTPEDRASDLEALDVEDLRPTTSDPSQPAEGNSRLWLRSTGPSNAWMDPDYEAAEQASTTITGSTGASGDETWHEFELRPPSKMDLALSRELATVKVHYTVGAQLGDAPHLEARLLVDGQEFSSAVQEGTGAGPTKLELLAPGKLAAGTDLALAVCVCASEGTLYGEYSLHTDGESWLDLPIESPVFEVSKDDEAPKEGSASSSGGDIQTSQENGYWVARQIVAFEGGLQGAGAVDVHLKTVAGGAEAAGGDVPGYRVVASLMGRGDTEDEAVAKLESIRLTHSDQVVAGTMALRTEATADDWNNRSAGLAAVVALGVPTPDVSLQTTSGGVAVRGLVGDEFRLKAVSGGVDIADVEARHVVADTTSGGVDVEDATVDDLSVSTSSGGVDIRGTTANDLSASTGSGGVDVEVRPSASGSYALHASSGGVSLRVPDSVEHGWDVEAEAGSGDVTIDLADTEPVGEQEEDHRHERTRGFDSRAIRTTVTCDTGSGGVDVAGS